MDNGTFRYEWIVKNATTEIISIKLNITLIVNLRYQQWYGSNY